MDEEKLECELGVDWLLIIDFNLKTEVLDHTPDFGGRLAWCREVAVHKDGVGWIEREWLETAQVMFAAASNANFGVWVQESEETEYFQTSLRGKLVAMF